MTFRAGLLDREKPLLDTHLAVAAAGRTDPRLRAFTRAGAMAAVALGHGGYTDARLGPTGCFLERDFEVVAQVGAAVDIRATAAAAEDIAEDVGKRIGETAHAAEAAAHARLGVDARMAKLVIGLALAGVGEHFVGLLRLLEKLLCFRIVRIAVRVILHRQPAIGFLDFFFRGVAIDAEDFIVIAFCHVDSTKP
jgi:hypothetical protein